MSTERDRHIGQTMSILRGDKTQQAVADEMRRRGWRWSQATVWSVEKGERALRLAEADDLAAVLGTVSVHSFLTEPVSAHIQQGVRRVTNAHRAIVESVWECLDAQDALTDRLKRAHADGHELTDVELVQRDLWARAPDVPEKAMAEARLEYEHRLREEGEVEDREGLEWGPDDDEH
jgi:hypothetical protein